MLTKEEAKEGVKKIVDDFLSIPKHEIDKKPEEQIKFQFIEPLLEVLGWSKKDIEKEERVLKGRADYLLRIGNQEVLIIEAKKTNVMLTEDEGRQAVSYAYHRKIKFAVLTNFKEIRIYHALSNIKNIDKNLLQIEGNYFRLDVNEFLDKFDWLWLLSRESFENKEINKLLSAKDEKLAKPIDESILADLLKIREWLSKDLKAKKNYLEKGQIDEIVQLLVDRLIFIRSVEDRGLEPKNILLGWDSDVRTQRVKYQLFPYLIEKFAEFNDKYDSRLFESNILEKEGAFSDDVLHKVIRALYFGSEDNQDRYLFDQIPGDLLGSIYEQYLGTILSETEKRVKLDSETGKRKKMGIFYTPSYIVDYIVKNTVAEYIKNKSIDEILEVKIVDPACGSGSFITKAFQEVCDSIEERLKKGETSNNSAFKSYHEKLSLVQKITILTRCIHGVDLDEKAIELARLNLLLKLLEGEGQETKKLLLPHLENNIRCGNSLIDDPKISDRAFNWHAQFPDVFKNGGFDIVIGNPPYIFAREKISENEKNYYSVTYSSSQYQLNTYLLFIEKSVRILKKEGIYGLIVPNAWLMISSAKKLREFLLEDNKIKEIINLSGHSFEDANVETIIIISEKDKSKNNDINILINAGTNFVYSHTKKQQLFFDNKNYEFNVFSDESSSDIITKLKTNSELLDNLCKIRAGLQAYESGKGKPIQTPIDVKKRPYDFNYKYDKETYRYLEGKDVGRYFIKWSGGYLKYGEHLAAPRTFEIFSEPKIIIREITGKFPKCIVSTFSDEIYLFNRSNIAISEKEKSAVSLQFILGIINSTLMSYYFIKNTAKSVRKLFPKIILEDLRKFPVHLPTPAQENKIIELVNQMLELQKKYHDSKISGSEKERFEQQIKNTDYEIDQEVYKLYGITEEEKEIIGESLK